MQRRIVLAAVVLVLALGLVFAQSLAVEAAGTPGLVVKKVDRIPSIDGDPSDPQWQGTYGVISDTTTWRAVYSDEEIAFLLTAKAPTMQAVVPSDWYYTAGEWVRWYEYQEGLGYVARRQRAHVNMLWDIEPTGTGMAEGGCAYVCHDEPGSAQLSRHAITPGESPGDSWSVLFSHGYGGINRLHSHGRNLGYVQASQEGPITFAVDDPSYPFAVNSGTFAFIGWADPRYWTYDNNPEFLGKADATETGQYCQNCHTEEFVETLSLQGKEGRMPYRLNGLEEPEYIKVNPVNFLDALTITDIDIRDGRAVRVADLSEKERLAAWQKYETLNAVVPSWILQEPSGEMASIPVAARWSDGLWVIEFKRALVTGDSLSVQFDNLDQDYYFTSAGGGFGNDAIRVTFER